jgi:hypothetical protein
MKETKLTGLGETETGKRGKQASIGETTHEREGKTSIGETNTGKKVK